jgi:alpha-galactosidase
MSTFELRTIVLLLATCVKAIDNGLGRTPPRGWRSWNQFHCSINQSLIESQYAERVDRSRLADGVPTSLLDLGYRTAGIDDCWQACDSGLGGVGFHDASGYPVVNRTLFPDMRAMAAKARALGLVAGWYGNNCHCSEQRQSCAMGNGSDACFVGDVKATMDFGFESIKLDGCGVQTNATHYARLLNATGTRILIENCGNGHPDYPSRDAAGVIDCPMNFFRTSMDIRPTFGSMLTNLRSTSAYNGAGLTGPGCFAYPDMLEVGVTNSQREAECKAFGQRGCTLDITEARTHFAAWCIVSAPLVLGNDLTDAKTMDLVWPIISNREALAVNDAWAGDAGVLAKQSDAKVWFNNCSWWHDPERCEHPAWMVWRKVLAKGKVALLLMNNDEVPTEISVAWLADLPRDTLQCPKGQCAIRDIHAHEDLPRASTFTAHVAAHDSRFIVVSE